MRADNVAWAAGVLEGEGCFSIFTRARGNRTRTCAIHCEMTDEDIVRRLHTIFQVGTVIVRTNTTGRSDQRPRKTSWIWSVQNKLGVTSVISEVLPWLGNRRKAKALEILEILNNES